MEQHHRPIKQRYYPMLGFGTFESASWFCSAFDELRNYLRFSGPNHNGITAAEKRTVFTARWSTLMTELAA
jgi:putative transposase